MKRLTVLLFLSVFLAACAGNPPAWWNPANRYGQTATVTQTQPKTPVQKIVIQEETMDPLPDDSYVEETIVPLPQEPEPETTEEEPGLPTPSVLE